MMSYKRYSEMTPLERLEKKNKRAVECPVCKHVTVLKEIIDLVSCGSCGWKNPKLWKQDGKK